MILREEVIKLSEIGIKKGEIGKNGREDIIK